MNFYEGVVVGIFNIFGGSKKRSDVDSIVAGYLRGETGRLQGEDPNSKAYDEFILLIREGVQGFATMVDKQILTDVVTTLASVSLERRDELFGDYLILCFVRFSIVALAVSAGEVSGEEATPDIVASVLHEDIKHLIRSYK